MLLCNNGEKKSFRKMTIYPRDGLRYALTGPISARSYSSEGVGHARNAGPDETEVEASPLEPSAASAGCNRPVNSQQNTTQTKPAFHPARTSVG